GPGVVARPPDRRAHGGEVHEKRNTGEVLQDDPRDHERDLGGPLTLRRPFGERSDVLLLDLAAVDVAQQRFEHDPDAHREPRDRADPGLLESWHGEEGAAAPRSGLELAAVGEHARTTEI